MSDRAKKRSNVRARSGRGLLRLLAVGLVGLLYACSEPPQDSTAQAPQTSQAPAPPTTSPAGPADAPGMEKGMFFKPDLSEFALHNEYDDDGDGDGIKETHVRRYINKAGDTAFSMTTSGTLWAWSLDTKDDDADIRKNYVIRDSNCDTVFDERYSLDAQFTVPACLAKAGAEGK